jgi:hypothetical protein
LSPTHCPFGSTPGIPLLVLHRFLTHTAQLLESIGVFPKGNQNSAPYQGNVAIPLSSQFDDELVGLEDQEAALPLGNDIALEGALTVVTKVYSTRK